MGWPKKNEGARLYFERAAKTYLLVFPDLVCTSGNLECVGEVMCHNNPENPRLASSSASPSYLYQKARRAQWDEMPQVWQENMSLWLNDRPEDIRGLWRMESLPKRIANRLHK